MNKIPSGFGNTLRELRKRRMLTQEQLAEKIGITTNAVGQFEHGKIFPTYETIPNIIITLDVNANLFFSEPPLIIQTKLNGLLE